MKEALSGESLDAVAGGDAICYDTYLPGENCLLTDECDVIFLSCSEQPAANIPAVGDDECSKSYITMCQSDSWNVWIEDFSEMNQYSGT